MYKSTIAKGTLARKILTYGINAFVREHRSGMLNNENLGGDDLIIQFQIEDIPAISLVRDIGHGELAIMVALWPTETAVKRLDVAISSKSARRERWIFRARLA